MSPTTRFDLEADVVVIGSGAAGMVAAWTAKRLGLDTVIIEKAPVFGGNSALSGGGAWLPNAPVFRRLGEADDPEKLFAYLRAIAPDVAPERHRRYLEEAPRLAEAFEDSPYYAGGKGFFWIEGYSDYHPDKGGNPKGRGLWATPIDERELRDNMTRRRGHGRAGKIPGLPSGSYLTSYDFRELLTLTYGGLRGPRTIARILYRSLMARLTGRRVVASGAALTTRLRLMLEDAQVPLLLQTPMHSLIQDDAGRVVGVAAKQEEKPFRIRARHGVVIAAGGFEGCRKYRALYQPAVVSAGTQGSPDNIGDWIDPARTVGAMFDLMDDSWWMPALEMPGAIWAVLAERQYPHQFIVNGAGKRFVNEASPYCDFGHAMIEGNKRGVPHFPSYMIIDSHAWRRYMFRGLPGRKMPSEWFTSGLVKKASTPIGLAAQIGVPAETLLETWDRFNRFARQGVDEDFHRGQSPYDNWNGNPNYPNPNLGEVKKPPFYAFRVVLSDLGTKGGILTNENAQALREDGSAIEGLYAAGNSSAAVMGNDYAGPGATLGPAMTFGWIAAHHIANRAGSATTGD